MVKKHLKKNNSPGESDRCENNFMHFNHQDNTLERSLQRFQTNYHISLGNSEIYKQTERQTV